MHKFFSALLALSLLAVPAWAQPELDEKGDSPKGPPAAQAPKANTANKADGISLPPDATVRSDEGFVSIQAECKGDVKFLVISSVKVKYITNGNTVIVSIPCTGGVITVFAIGNVGGKMTDFVSTNIQISSASAPPGPAPPGPNPPGPAAKGPFHVTFVLDLNNTTPQVAQLLNNPNLRKSVTDAGHFFRIYDKSSPVVAQRGLDKVMQQVGGNNAMIVQTDQGAVVSATPIPASEAEVMGILRKAGGR